MTYIPRDPVMTSIPRDPDAKIILRSSDGQEFIVRKSLLSQASPVFSNMFTAGVPQHNSNPDRHGDSNAPTNFIDLSEHSKTVNLIISLVSAPPATGTSLLIDSLSDIDNLLQAADKYDMKIIRDHAVHSLTQSKALKNEPLRVFAIAHRYRVQDTATLAAKNSIRLPLLQAENISELKKVDGLTIYNVLRYHKQCTAAALKVATDHTWIKNADTYVFFDCPGVSPDDEDYEDDYDDDEDSDDDDDDDDDVEDNKERTNTITIRTPRSRKHKDGYLKEVSVHPWWTKFMATTKVALSESNNSETIRDKGRVMEALLSASRCPHCRRHVKADFLNFFGGVCN